MRFLKPLLIDEPAQLVATIADVTHKPGRSGDLVFVEVDRMLRPQGTARLQEQQSFVYRGGREAVVPLPVPAADPIEGALWEPTSVSLLRFYATAGALIVDGPFTAARLAALASSRGALASFEIRAMAPRSSVSRSACSMSATTKSVPSTVTAPSP